MVESEHKSIETEIMSKIKSGRYHMKPRWYFWVGSLSLFVGTVTSLMAASFATSFLSFILRARSSFWQIKFLKTLDRFSLGMILLAAVSLAVGIWLLKQYDFSYHKNFKGIIIGLICAVLLSGWIMDGIGFNDALMRRGPGPMKRWWKEQSYQPNRKFHRLSPSPKNFPQKLPLNGPTAEGPIINRRLPILNRQYGTSTKNKIPDNHQEEETH